VEQEEARLFTVGSQRDSAGVYGLMNDHAQVPIHTQYLDTENIFATLDRDIGHAHDFVGIFDALFARDECRRVPTGHVRYSFASSINSPERFVSTGTGV
jgi:hypothetical protein